LRNANPEMVKEFIENYGDRPRVYRNSLLFLCPLESEKGPFEKSLKEKLAWQEIEKDRTLELSADQKERVKSKINEIENKINGLLRKVYCIIYLPQKDEPERIDLGVPTSGVKRGVVEEIYNRLKDEGKVVEKLSGHYLKDKYLREKAYVETKNILDSFYKIPGEIRIRNKEVLVNAIKEGVRQGFFGLGYLENGEPDCKYINTNVEPNFEEEEILINPELCVEKEEEIRYIPKEEISSQPTKLTLSEFGEKEIGKKEEMFERVPSQESRSKYKQLYLKLRSAPGKLSGIVKAINLLREKFENVNIRVEISAKDGEMLKSEYEDKIKEAINQLGLEIEEEKLD
jgi:hypothetical protein